MVKKCRSPLRCSTCNGRHHSSICSGMTQGTSQSSPLPSVLTSSPRPLSSPQSKQPSTVSMYIDMKTPVLLQTATAIVYSANRPNNTTVIRLILDSGSQKSYITNKLRDSLRLPREQSQAVSIKTFGSLVERVETCDIVKLKFKARMGADFEISLFTVPMICEPLSRQPIIWAVERFPYLQEIDLPDLCDSRDALEMSIFIGVDQYWKVVTGGIRRGNTGPTAMKTKLGWVLSGPVPGLTHDPSVAYLSCSHVLKVDTSVNLVP